MEIQILVSNVMMATITEMMDVILFVLYKEILFVMLMDVHYVVMEWQIIYKIVMMQIILIMMDVQIIVGYRIWPLVVMGLNNRISNAMMVIQMIMMVVLFFARNQMILFVRLAVQVQVFALDVEMDVKIQDRFVMMVILKQMTDVFNVQFKQINLNVLRLFQHNVQGCL